MNIAFPFSFLLSTLTCVSDLAFSCDDFFSFFLLYGWMMDGCTRVVFGYHK